MWRVLWLAVMAAGGRDRGVVRPSLDVATSGGVVRGYLSAGHYAFLGVPYARAPLRPRFKAPEPPQPWDGTFEATHRVKCPQPDGSGEENCLVVNLFVPKLRNMPSMRVLVSVHGGGFSSGWGAHSPPKQFKEEFLTVTFNFRIGVLGYLCLGSRGAPGNAGLKDQVTALYWIKNNVGNFGGNPHDITVYGSGSGAASLQLLLLSGMTKDLFHRIILDSGSALSPTTLAYDPVGTALQYALSLGHEDFGDMEALELFYESVSVPLIVNTTFMFMPCVENHFLFTNNLIDRDPLESLRLGTFHKVPMILLYSNAEQIDLIDQEPDRFHDVPDNFEDLLPNNLEFRKEVTREKVAVLVRNSYFKEMYERNIITLHMEYINDIFMEYPVIKFATLYAEKSRYPVYVMKFLYSSETDNPGGARFGDVNKYVFGNKDVDEEDETAVTRLITMLKNFMKLGDPTPLKTSLVPIVWPPISANQHENFTDISKAIYLIFDRQLYINSREMTQSCIFWDLVYSRFYKWHKFTRNQTEDDSVYQLQFDPQSTSISIDISQEIYGDQDSTAVTLKPVTEAPKVPATAYESSIASYFMKDRKKQRIK